MKKNCSKQRKIVAKPKPVLLNDRISELPQPILHHIMSFLPKRDATITSSLSKLWYAAWNTSPVLDFNQFFFEKDIFRRNGTPKQRQVQQFCDYVNRATLRRCVQFNNFSLQKCQIKLYSRCSVPVVPLQDLYRWLDRAMSNNVRELSLINSMHRHFYRKLLVVLPVSLFSYSSLRELDLLCCEFPEYEFSNTGIGSSLKKLSLYRVYADQHTLQSFLTSCRIIEQVEINLCLGFESVKLVGRKLDEVDLSLDQDKIQSVAIEAPNVRVLKYSGADFNIRGSIMDSGICENVQKLRLHNCGLPDDILEVIRLKFPMVEKLEMKNCTFGHFKNCSLIHSLVFHGCERIKELQFADLRMKGLKICFTNIKR